MAAITDAELDTINNPNERSMFQVARRMLVALDGINAQLKELNETLSGVVSDFNYQSSPGKTYRAVRTYESNR